MAIGDIHHRLAPFQRHSPAHRVLVSRNRVDQLRLLALSRRPDDLRLQRVGKHTLGIRFDTPHVRAEATQLAQRPGVHEVLRQRDVPWIYQHFQEHVDRLSRSVAQDDVVRRNVNIAFPRQLVRHELPEWPVPLRMGVDGEILAFLPERVLKPAYQAVERNGLRIRVGDRKVILAALYRPRPRSALRRVPRKQTIETELVIFRHTVPSFGPPNHRRAGDIEFSSFYTVRAQPR